jgi:hypothetical protein
VITFLVIGLAGGILFALLDFIINVNPLARRLSEPYRPIARKQLPLIAAVLIDLLWGLAMAGIFLLLRPAYAAGGVLAAGVSFGLLAWFFRVLMGAVSQWVMFEIPAATLLYSVAAGLAEMTAIGLFYAMTFSALE